jgi:hypothetical protein
MDSLEIHVWMSAPCCMLPGDGIIAAPITVSLQLPKSHFQPSNEFGERCLIYVHTIPTVPRYTLLLVYPSRVGIFSSVMV